MDAKKLIALVKEVVARELDLTADAIGNSKSLRAEYGLDSVAAVNIVFALENQLGVVIDMKALASVDCIDDLHRLLAKNEQIADQLNKLPP